MPTYDYRCENCGHTLETFQSIKDRPLRKCPACGKNALKRLLGAGAALIFKGSGFYCTDYKKGGASSTPPEARKESTAAGHAKSAPVDSGSSKSSGDGKKKD